MGSFQEPPVKGQENVTQRGLCPQPPLNVLGRRSRPRRRRLAVQGLEIFHAVLEDLFDRQFRDRVVGVIVQEAADEGSRGFGIEAAGAHRGPVAPFAGEPIPGQQGPEFADQSRGEVILGRRGRRKGNRTGPTVRIDVGLIRQVPVVFRQQRPVCRVKQVECRLQDTPLKRRVAGETEGSPQREADPERPWR